MLVSGEHPYPSRSEAALALAMAMANRGWSWEEFHAALSNPDNGMTEYYTHRRNASPRTSHDTAARLRRDWDKAVETTVTSPAIADYKEMRQELSMELATLRDEVWTGRTAATDYVVLTAAYEKAIARGQRTLPLASRTMAEMTGVSHRTAARSLARLVEAGELRLISRPEDGAWVYALVKRQCINDPGISRGRPPSGGGSSVHSLLDLVSSNVFRWLGRHAAMVYRAVLDGARTVGEIVESSGVSRRTVFKYLELMARSGLGLISKESWGYTAREVDDLEAEAGDLGLPDAAGAQRERHRQEREGWREVMPQVVKARKWIKILRRRFPR